MYVQAGLKKKKEKKKEKVVSVQGFEILRSGFSYF